MPMNGPRLGNELFEACVPASVRSKMSASEINDAKTNFMNMGVTIVNHIISNATITVNPGQTVNGTGIVAIPMTSPTGTPSAGTSVNTGVTSSPGTARIM